MVMLVRSLLLVVPLLVLSTVFPQCLGEWRSLSEITYNFTTCNSSGQTGPSYQTCLNYYQAIDSQIATALNDDPEEQGFSGGQGFRFPHSGVYNITVAGASGGRGLCNTKTSRGVVLKTQLTIQEGINDSVLVLVGQKGVGPCDSNPNYHICLSPPTNLNEAAQCLTNWMSVSMSLQYQDRLGGGGGGGASMIWPQNSTGHFNRSVLPFVIAGGGGGTSLQTDYRAILGNFFSRDVANIRLVNETDEELYQRWIDARPSETDAYSQSGSYSPGIVGNRPAVEGEGASIVSGAGSGWYFAGITFAEIDGRPLSRSANFAKGGLDCIIGFGFQENNLPFKSINGGFGGGGGGCSEGGGGGGFGGGIVLTDGPAIPGSGGYSLNSTNIGLNEGDGFVEIVPADCGCTYGCLVNHEDSLFQCICPSSTQLSSNGMDCITLATSVEEDEFTQDNFVESFVGNETVYSSLVRFESLVILYSASVTFSISGDSTSIAKRQISSEESDGEDDPNCILVWLDGNLTPVLISDSINGSLRRITGDNIISDYMPILTDGQIVSSGVVIGSSNCSVGNVTISRSTRVINATVPNISLQNITSSHNATFRAIISQILLPRMLSSSTTTAVSRPTGSSFIHSSISNEFDQFTASISTPASFTTPSTPPSLEPFFSRQEFIIAASAAGGLLFLTCCLIIIIAVIICAVRRKKSSSLRRVYQIKAESTDQLQGIPLTSDDQIQLQKLRFKLASLKSNPNYGRSSIRGSSHDTTDFGEKKSQISSIEVADIENGYTPMSFEKGQSDERHGSNSDGTLERQRIAQPHRIRSRSRRKTFTLRPKYGVMSPSVSFYEYNRDRQDDDWEYDRTQLTYLREIGEGQFGKVLLMKAKNIAGYKGKLPVAVKTLTSIEDEDVKKFLEEIELMKKFANPHIVSLLGVSAGSSEGAPLMILEYMPYGDLQSFLAKHKPRQGEHTLIGLYHQIRFAGDIANAMSFLETKKYVHRDVAARNCLVGPNLEVKVADFGMARVVQEKDYYRIAGRAILPVRWMAPESLLYGIFTSASDVWAYGVLLWEIASYGSIPLESSKAQEIVDMAQHQTLYHAWPQNGPDELLQIKEECHSYEAEKRPRFEDIANLLPSSSKSS